MSDSLGPADFIAAAEVCCPYCGEQVTITLDPTGGASQDYVEDCEVCCRPWRILVSFDPDGFPDVSVTAADDL